MIHAKYVFIVGGFLAATLACSTSEARCLKVSGSVAKEKRSPGTFRALRVMGSMDVNIKQGNGHAVTVEAPAQAIPRIETRVEGDTLVITTKECMNVRGTMRVWVTLKELKGLAIRGSGDVRGQSAFRARELHTEVAGSGDVDLELAVETVHVEIAGSGDVRLRGTAKNQRFSIHGSGDIRAEGLRGADARVRVNGSGDVRVHVTESLDAAVHGSGDIVYLGNPKKVSTSVHGGGDIRPGN